MKKFSIRQLLALMLIAGLSLQAYIQRKRVTFLKESNQVEWAKYEKLESKALSLRQRTAVCKRVVTDWPSPAAEYLAAQERFQQLQVAERETHDR